MHKNQQGFTLLEWLLSLTIGLFLLTFSSQLYINVLKTAYFIRGNQEINDNERVAFSFLSRDIRLAGFIGCPNLAEVSTSNKQHVFTESIMGWHQGSSSSGLTIPIQKALKKSDMLCLQYADPHGLSIIKAQKNTIQFAHRPTFSPNEVLLLSDCRHAEIVQLAHLKLQHAYEADAMISRFYRIVYYVARTGRKNSAQKPIYALYRQDLNAPHHPTELVENVEKLEIHYGVMTPQGAMQYVTADQVTHWEHVRSVTVVLHFTSADRFISAQSSSQRPERLQHIAQQTIMIRGRSNSFI